MSSDNIKVAIRIRPLIKREDNKQIQWKIENNHISQIDKNGQPMNEPFTFDHIFTSEKSNKVIYSEVVDSFVESSLNGLNATIFAYGQTSSGKTYTMLGNNNDPGIVQCAIERIFKNIQECTTRKFLLRVSYIEIYNEKINDLLSPSTKNIKIRESAQGAIGLQNVTEEIVSTAEDCYQLIKLGNSNRVSTKTQMNERSSRSHAIFRMIIESTECNDFHEKDRTVQTSNLNLVDLAGSERVAQTKATGVQLKEGGHINKSLTALGVVIRQLSDGQDFINFRDSKLTRLLQHSLGGNSKTLIITAITLTSVEDTYSTLCFAQHAKLIKNKPKINEILSEAELTKRYGELRKCLQEQLQKNQYLEKDKEENSKRINSLENQIRMLEVFQGIDFSDDSLLVTKRRHTIGYLCRKKPVLKSINEETCLGQSTIMEEGNEAEDEVTAQNTSRTCNLYKYKNPANHPTDNSEYGTPKGFLRDRVNYLTREYNELAEFTRMEENIYEKQLKQAEKELKQFKEREQELLKKNSNLEKLLYKDLLVDCEKLKDILSCNSSTNGVDAIDKNVPPCNNPTKNMNIRGDSIAEHSQYEKDSNYGLTFKIEQLEKQVAILKETNSSKEIEFQNEKHKNEELNNKLIDLERNLDQYKRDCNYKLTFKIEQLEEQVMTLKETNSSKEIEYQNEKYKNEELNTKLIDLSNRQIEYQKEKYELNSTIKELENKIVILNDSNNRKEIEYQDEKSKNEQLNSSLLELQQKLKKVNEDFKNSEIKSYNAQHKNEELNLYIKQLNNQLNELNKSNNEIISKELTLKLDELEKQVIKLKEINNSKEIEYQCEKSKNEQLNFTLKELNQRLELLNQDVKMTKVEYEMEKQKNQELNLKIEKLKGTINTLTEDLSNRQNEYQKEKYELNSTIKELENKIVKLNDSNNRKEMEYQDEKSKNEQLNSSLLELQQKLKKVNEDYKNSEIKSYNVQHKNEELNLYIKQLNNQLNELNKSNNEIISKELTLKLDELEKQVIKLKAINNSKEIEYQCEKSKNEQLNFTLKELNQRLELLNQDVKMTRVEYEMEKQKSQELNLKIEKLKGTINTLTEDLSNRQIEYQKEKYELNSTRKELENKIVILNDSNNRKEIEYQDEKSKNEQLNSTLLELQQKLKKVNEDFKNSEIKSYNVQHKNEELNLFIKQLNNQLNELNKSNNEIISKELTLKLDELEQQVIKLKEINNSKEIEYQCEKSKNEQLNFTLKEVNQRLEVLNQDVKMTKVEYEMEKQKNQELNLKIEKLDMDLNILNEKIFEGNEECKYCNELRIQMSNVKEKLERKMERYRQAWLNNYCEKCPKLQEEIEQLRKKLDNQTESELSIQLNKLKEEHNQLRTLHQDAVWKRMSMESKFLQFEREKKEIEATGVFKMLKGENDDLRRKIRKLESQNKANEECMSTDFLVSANNQIKKTENTAIQCDIWNQQEHDALFKKYELYRRVCILRKEEIDKLKQQTNE